MDYPREETCLLVFWRGSCVCVLSTSNPQEECGLPSGGDLSVSIQEGFLCV